MPFMDALAAKACQVYKNNSCGYLAREILCTCLALADFLDEFHPNPIDFSSEVERLVRLLVVIQAALEKDKKERGIFF